MEASDPVLPHARSTGPESVGRPRLRAYSPARGEPAAPSRSVVAGSTACVRIRAVARGHRRRRAAESRSHDLP